jgi:hypothetical protein
MKNDCKDELDENVYFDTKMATIMNGLLKTQCESVYNPVGALRSCLILRLASDNIAKANCQDDVQENVDAQRGHAVASAEVDKILKRVERKLERHKERKGWESAVQSERTQCRNNKLRQHKPTLNKVKFVLEKDLQDEATTPFADKMNDCAEQIVGENTKAAIDACVDQAKTVASTTAFLGGNVADLTYSDLKKTQDDGAELLAVRERGKCVDKMGKRIKPIKRLLWSIKIYIVFTPYLLFLLFMKIEI